MSEVVIAETLRRHLVRPGFLLALVLLGMVGMFASSFNTPGAMWPWLVTVLAIITGAAIVGPELSTGALQLIVSKPIRRWSYVLSRVAGVFASVCLAATVGLLGESIPRLMLARSAMPWGRLAVVFCGALVISLQTIALLTFLGSITRSYFNVAIYLGVEMALSATEVLAGLLRVRGPLAGILESHPEIERGLITLNNFLYPAVPMELDAGWLLRILATVVVALTLACLAFERREVPYGAE